MADFDPTVPQLTQSFPTLQPNTSGASSGTATETPYGATKANPLGVEKGALQERVAANKDLTGAQTETDENALNRSVIGQEKADATLGANATDLEDLHKFNDLYMKDFAERRAGAKALESKIGEAAQFHDHFTSKNVGDRVIATIASGLLGFGTGQAHNVVADIEKADHEQQAHQLEALMKEAERYGANTTQLREIYTEASNNMHLARALKLEKIAAEYERQGAAAGTVEAVTAGKMHAAQLRKVKNEEMLKYDEGLRTKSNKTATHALKTPGNTGRTEF